MTWEFLCLNKPLSSINVLTCILPLSFRRKVSGSSTQNPIVNWIREKGNVILRKNIVKKFYRSSIVIIWHAERNAADKFIKNCFRLVWKHERPQRAHQTTFSPISTSVDILRFWKLSNLRPKSITQSRWEAVNFWYPIDINQFQSEYFHADYFDVQSEKFGDQQLNWGDAVWIANWTDFICHDGIIEQRNQTASWMNLFLFRTR